MLRSYFIALCCFLFNTYCFSQYDWKLEKNKNGIKVYLSDVPGKNFKAAKVDCTLTGTYAKLVGPRFLTITGTGEPGLLPKTSGKVRVSYFKANWKVTMPSAQTINIIYTIELDPGGSVPAWIANMFADKGPYESFSNLADLLKK